MIVTLDKVMGSVAYNAYSMAPNNVPRKIDAVMEKVHEYLLEHLEQPISSDKTFWCKEFDKSEISNFVHDMLFSIPEFEELNLSQSEFEQGISVDDENRGKISFVTRYDIRDDDFWKTDFIDLDAFVRNVYMTILKTND